MCLYLLINRSLVSSFLIISSKKYYEHPNLEQRIIFDQNFIKAAFISYQQAAYDQYLTINFRKFFKKQLTMNNATIKISLIFRVTSCIHLHCFLFLYFLFRKNNNKKNCELRTQHINCCLNAEKNHQPLSHHKLLMSLNALLSNKHQNES